MKKHINILLFKTLIIIAIFGLQNAFAQNSTDPGQNEVINNSKVSLKAGSSKDLARYFNDMIDIGFDGDKSNYSKTQAEFVLKDFFKKYPPSDFQYVHQGASKEGSKYLIGTYTYTGGTYRVYILIKQYKGRFLIDTLDFSQE